MIPSCLAVPNDKQPASLVRHVSVTRTSYSNYIPHHYDPAMRRDPRPPTFAPAVLARYSALRSVHAVCVCKARMHA